MVVAAQDRAVPQAHPDIAHPHGPGRCGRPEARFFDSQGPGGEAADGGQDHGLYEQDRSRDREASRHDRSSPPAPLTDAASAFLQAVRANVSDVARFASFALEEIRSRRWTSVTFQGGRHELAFSLEGEGAEEAAGRFLSRLDARNFALRGHLVADVSLVAQERRPGFARIRLDALTVEEK